MEYLDLILGGTGSFFPSEGIFFTGNFFCFYIRNLLWKAGRYFLYGFAIQDKPVIVFFAGKDDRVRIFFLFGCQCCDFLPTISLFGRTIKRISLGKFGT